MSKKILVVDDSLMVRIQVRKALGDGFEITDAVDGLDALEQLAANRDTALIICDVNMPKMNGIDFLKSRAEDAELARVPVVMLTTEGQQTLIEHARQLGALAWLLKPFKPENLLAVARKITAAA